MKQLKFLVAGLILAIAVPCFAQPQSFLATNKLASGVDLQSYPTNASLIGVNGWKTGQPIDVLNHPQVGLYVRGLNLSGSNGTITVSLIRAIDPVPVVVLDSNNKIATNSWENGQGQNFDIIMSTPINAGYTNYFFWTTNLPENWVRPARWIGVYNITNNTTNSLILTNFDVGLFKKVPFFRQP